jgi:hypothetical protein
LNNAQLCHSPISVLLKGVGGVADYAHLLVGLISRRRPQNGYPAQLD